MANPFSGSGRNRLLVERLERGLRDRGLEVEALWTPAQRAERLPDPSWQADCRCVIAAGGDGTVGDVINATTDLPLAVLPMGNENLFAREFGFRKVDRLVEAVARGRTRRTDLARAGGRRFSVMLSAGLDAEVVHRVARWRSGGGADAGGASLRRIRRLSYVAPTLAALRRYDYPPITLEADGRTVSGATVLVCNLPQYAMRLKPAPEAAAVSGRLHWVVLHRPGAAAIGQYLLSMALGRHTRRRDVSSGTADVVRLTAPNAVPLQVDGDPAGHTPVEVVIEPAALEVIDTRAAASAEQREATDRSASERASTGESGPRPAAEAARLET